MHLIDITGNLTKDPEYRTTPSGKNVCTFTVASNRQFDKHEDGKAVTDYFYVSAWSGLADACRKSLKKGNKVRVYGELQLRPYEVQGERRFSLDVPAERVEFLSPKNVTTTQRTSDDFDSYDDVSTDDIPF